MVVYGYQYLWIFVIGYEYVWLFINICDCSMIMSWLFDGCFMIVLRLSYDHFMISLCLCCEYVMISLCLLYDYVINKFMIHDYLWWIITAYDGLCVFQVAMTSHGCFSWQYIFVISHLWWTMTIHYNYVSACYADTRRVVVKNSHQCTWWSWWRTFAQFPRLNVIPKHKHIASTTGPPASGRRKRRDERWSTSENGVVHGFFPKTMLL